jgi:LmbE family N-acetylglucosaminyl deacetylase
VKKGDQEFMSEGLLAIFAHPDDESFTMGGTLAHYAEAGVRVDLVCATRGEAGEISDPALAIPETLAQVREEELRCATAVLGIQELFFLDYRDSGMADSAENGRADAFVNAPAYLVVPRLVAIMRQLRPGVVVTFEPNGGYGHPDHLAIHRHTLAAFTAAGAPNYRPDLGPAWQSERLFYTAFPRAHFDAMRRRFQEHGLDTAELDSWLVQRGESFWPETAVDVTIDVAAVIDKKLAAMYCHRTQIGPQNIFFQLPEAAMRQQWRQEYFALAWAAGRREPLLADLFDGLPEK